MFDRFRSKATLTSDAVRTILGNVSLPDGSKLGSSPRLGDIVIKDGDKVMAAITIEPKDAQAMEPVRKAAQEAIAAMPGVKNALVSLTADVPAGTSASAPPPKPHGHGPAPAQPVEGIKHILAVASGKGGVGKSTTSCNLALGLAAMGLKVGILDADIYGPSMPMLFGLVGARPELTEDRFMVPLEAYGVKLMSIGFLVDDSQAMIWRGPMVVSALNQMLKQVEWGELDVLVVDLPPGTGDAQLTMVQNTPIGGAVIVSTPQDLALIDARRGVAMFEKTQVPILGLIENMASFACPNCGHESHIFGHGGARAEAAKLGVPFLGEVPLDMDVRERSDSGKPITATKPDSRHAQIYKDMAKQVWANLTGTGEIKQKSAPKIVFE